MTGSSLRIHICEEEADYTTMYMRSIPPPEERVRLSQTLSLPSEP